MSLFDKWAQCENTEEQRKRYQKALKAENTPIEIEAEMQKGKFSGNHGDYITSLLDCTCVDFRTRKLPCKHMYRLAIELGIITGCAETDPTKIIKYDKTPYMPLDKAVAIVETLSLNSQRILREILLDVVYRKKDFYKKSKKQSYEELLSCGLVEETAEGKGIRPIPFLKKVQKNLCIYLGRRNENDDYFDGEKWASVPKGAQHRATVSIALSGSKVTSSLAFPDDKITDLLNKYGVNRCAPPKEDKK